MSSSSAARFECEHGMREGTCKTCDPPKTQGVTSVQQVGGSHYNNQSGNAHWDLAARFDLEYLLATATKYIARWDLKGAPVMDLEKAISYIAKFQATRQFPLTGCQRTVPSEFMWGFFLDQNWRVTVPREAEKRLLFELIHVDGSSLALRTAVGYLGQMVEREKLVSPK